jgi:hypothetical protein
MILYKRALILSKIAGPFTGYGSCFRCGLSCKYHELFHETQYTSTNACFPLCEHCWQVLETPQDRLSYYRSLVFGMWHDQSKWSIIKEAVMAGK